jgi:uncharacterized membrane protein
MEEWLIYISRHAVILLNGFALCVILYGALQAFVVAAGMVLKPRTKFDSFVWLRFGRWLVAGLTFQLAADIIETAITPHWEEIGRLAAIAAIRTALSYFLERDLSEIRERIEEPAPATEAQPRSSAAAGD